jgi:small subunit ribosomal protein S16
MLAIKLQRIGKKHQPSYRIVVANKRSKMIAPPVDDLGSYNTTSKIFTIDSKRTVDWMHKGARPTSTVFNLLVSHKVVDAPKMPVRIKAKKAGAS